MAIEAIEAIEAVEAPIEARPLLLRRSASQLLDRRIDGEPETAVRTLLAVQAQDRMSWRLALRARVAGITAADVNQALTEKRSLTVVWANRGTLHLICSEDYPWLLALTAPTTVNANARRLSQEGLPPDDADRAVAFIERTLAAEGPLTRSQLRSRLIDRGFRIEGQAMVQLLFATVNRGVAVLGPMAGVHHAFAHTSEWLGTAPVQLTGEGRERALGELARRYLTGHGPATERDLAKWAGLPLRDARAGLRSIGPELVEMHGGLLDLARRDPRSRGSQAGAEGNMPGTTSSPSPRLLPAWDPCLVGWAQREPFLRREDDALAIPAGGGLFRPVATVDGVVAATWGIKRERDRVAIRIEPFRPLDADAQAGLRAEAEDVARFEGKALAGNPTFGTVG